MNLKGLTWNAMLVGLAGIVGVAAFAPRARAAGCADLNNDGRVTIGDAIRLIQAVGVGPSAVDCGGAGSLSCGDLNADGALSVADVVTLLNALTGNPTLFPLCQGKGNVIACSGGKATVTGNLTTNQEWSAACPVYVDGLTFVQPGVTITIDPGTTIVGMDPPTQNGGPTNVSALIFLRGSKINAAGTPTQPIVMTSQDHFEHNNGHIGDWGGLTINGNAPVNCPGGECLAEGLVGVPFGGSNPNDSSGVMEYVRVEFSGRELTPDNELNIITYNGVGRGSVFDHIQANVGFDDCQEWFGGTVNMKYLVDSGCGDDLFDTQLATTGEYQYLLGVYYNPYMQNAGNHGFEWDNNENGFDLLPRNAPKVCNFTMIGTALQPNAVGENSERGTNLRRGTAGIIANTIWEHFRNAGLLVSDNATAAQACTNATTLKPGGLLVEHSLLFDNGNDGGAPLQVTGNWTSPCTPQQWYALLPSVSPSNPTQNGSDPQIPVVYGLGLPASQTDLNQFIPAGSSPGVASNPLVNSLAMDCKSIDPTFFDTTNYVGAFRPGDPASNWLTSPWISFHLQ
ncbi:MAG TPA: hypothetical protein VFA06_25105 [Actinocrinis sp.]|uniref:hypothetical protein n=1 Tax=Actinocrinis sp. TaxID=1920516 RepID=UPI002D718FEB|nr:hypothetical protein [Actinocrinis sp.]HZU59183.1 hypothetical protein [Actinocrinis sp.]